MRTDAEIVDSRKALRFIAGILAITGAFVVIRQLLQLIQNDFEWVNLLMPIGASYGTYLFGFFAWKGHLPKAFMKNESAAESKHTRRET